MEHEMHKEEMIDMKGMMMDMKGMMMDMKEMMEHMMMNQKGMMKMMCDSKGMSPLDRHYGKGGKM